jgi:hypothetical protein
MRTSIIPVGAALLLAVPALAQAVDPHAGHAMPAAGAAAPMDHSKMNMGPPPVAGGDAMQGMDHSGMDHSGMDHGSMDHSGMTNSGTNHGGMAMAPPPKGITRTRIGPAEAALQAFSNALEVGNRDLAIARLSPDLKVVEDGVEEGYADYLGGHLGADMEFQKSVRTVLLARTVSRNSRTRVTIVSKIRMIGNRSDKPIDTIVDETAVLANGPGGWKIAQLEWVSAE